MSITKRAVRVLQVSGRVRGERDSFLSSLQKYTESERPRLVLDCSSVWKMDTATIRLLLSCLEEVMRYNGDVRLASLSSDAEATLRSTGISRLFELYPTTEEAVQSFHQRPVSIAPLAFENESVDNENAA